MVASAAQILHRRGGRGRIGPRRIWRRIRILPTAAFALGAGRIILTRTVNGQLLDLFVHRPLPHRGLSLLNSLQIGFSLLLLLLLLSIAVGDGRVHDCLYYVCKVN